VFISPLNPVEPTLLARTYGVKAKIKASIVNPEWTEVDPSVRPRDHRLKALHAAIERTGQRTTAT
jgi:hypothetical protein